MNVVKICLQVIFLLIFFSPLISHEHTAGWLQIGSAVSSCARLTSMMENLAKRDRAEKAQAQVARGWRRRHEVKLQ